MDVSQLCQLWCPKNSGESDHERCQDSQGSRALVEGALVVVVHGCNGHGTMTAGREVVRIPWMANIMSCYQ